MWKLAAVMFILLSSVAEGQPSYLKVFRGTGTAQGNLNELSSGNLRIGVARQSGTALIDPLGGILQTHNYLIDSFLVLQAIKRYTDNDFYFVGGYQKDSCSASGTLTLPFIHPVIGHMDSLGNIEEAHHYVLNSERCNNNAQDLEVLQGGGAIVWGARQNVLFLLRSDANGQAAWAKSFSSTGSFRFVKELPGGDLIAGFNIDTAGGAVARLDADGNFIWCKSYFRPKGMVHDAIIESDDSFLITGYTDSTLTDFFTPLPLTFQPKLFMMKLNGDGEVQWCRGYDSAPHYWHTPKGSRIVRSQDSKYVVLATMGRSGYNWFYQPMLLKLNLNGDTIWTRTMGITGYDYEARDLLAYSDGGFLYDGRLWGDLPEGQASFAFLHKTDSLGHLPCAEHWHPLEILDLFPSDSSFVLSWTEGAVTFPAYLSDTTYPPIVQYDGCDFATSLQYISRLPKKATVRPNPTPGRFTVEFQDPLVKDSYYSVYDAMGKLLFQRVAAHGQKTEEVDLTGYGKGTYVIRFTDREGTCYERVVVE
ncbi:MAG: T9SS type A sorting domain-containing protein [Flavobacteriales bacterium]|nr:T9SS type A sorting domain-containing protein [Flavobacteriales bacterium]